MELSLLPIEWRVLDILRRNGPLSRVRLAALADVTPSTLTRVATALLGRGLIVNCGRHHDGKRGVPEQLLDLDGEGASAIGVSLTRRSLSVCLTDFVGEVRAFIEEPVDVADPDEVVRRAAAMIKAARAKARMPRPRLVGVGLVLPGAFRPGEARRLPVPGMERWSAVDVAGLFSDASGLPVIQDNDGNAASLAEAYFGRGRDYDDFAFLLLSEGIGGGLIQNRRLSRGAHGNAGEFGSRFPRHAPRPSASDYAEFLRAEGIGAGDVPGLNSLDVPDAVVQRWVARAAGQVAELLDALTWTLDPQALIIGGLLPRPVRAAIIAHLQTIQTEAVRNGLSQPDLVLSEFDGSLTRAAASLPLCQATSRIG